jgi:hypothetical protein
VEHSSARRHTQEQLYLEQPNQEQFSEGRPSHEPSGQARPCTESFIDEGQPGHNWEQHPHRTGLCTEIADYPVCGEDERYAIEHIAHIKKKRGMRWLETRCVELEVVHRGVLAGSAPPGWMSVMLLDLHAHS